MDFCARRVLLSWFWNCEGIAKIGQSRNVFARLYFQIENKIYKNGAYASVYIFTKYVKTNMTPFAVMYII